MAQETAFAQRMNVLLLCVLPPVTAGTIGDHVRALKLFSKHRVMCFPRLGLLSNDFPPGLEVENFDALVIHYTAYLLSDNHLGPAAKARIAAFCGVKILFLQDEYRQIDRMTTIISDLGIDVLFTCVPEVEIEKIYPSDRLPGLVKIANLTGYVPKGLAGLRVPAISQRSLDVGYRARIVPFWLGRLGAEKWQIVPRFLEATKDADLSCDLSNREEDRIYGKGWIRFVASCKVMLGVESGASVFDFAGSIQREVDDFLAQNPSTTFEEVQDRFLRDHEGKVRLNQISPRCFEAAALRTAMVLYEGEYSGILQPWRHYIPLRKDFGNIGEVVAAIRDTRRLQEIADRAYEEIAQNPQWSYETFVGRFDAALLAAHARKKRPVRGSVSRLKFQLAVLPSAVIPLLIQIWIRIPAGTRAFLKPLLSTLISAFRRHAR